MLNKTVVKWRKYWSTNSTHSNYK